MNILQWMREHHVFFDGGLGSLLQAKGLKAGELPETWNLLHPQELVEIHKSYLNAGANVITTNTFGANRLKYPKGGAWELEDLVQAAVENAKKARREFIEEKQRLAAGKEEGEISAAGTLEPYYIGLDLGPTGKLLKPLGDLEFERAVELYKEVIGIGQDAGADFILIETMSDSLEVKAAVLAAKESCGLPVFATICCC